MRAFQTVYDVSRSPVEFPWSMASAGWMLGFVIVVLVVRNKVMGKPVHFVWLWLVLWIMLGGIGFAAVCHEHSRCVQELKSGEFQVVEGPVIRFQPKRGRRSAQFTVAGVTLRNIPPSLLGDGMPSTSGNASLLHAGAYVRVAYDVRGVILRVEIRQTPGDG